LNLLDDLKNAYQKIGLNVEGRELDQGDVSLFMDVKIHPAAKQESIIIRDSTLNVFVKDKPVEGQANQRLCKVLSKSLGISPSSVLIDKGHRSKVKKVVLNYQITANKNVMFFTEKIEHLCSK
jgi:uncharacterized protein (TIGR00251 family)